MTEGTNEEGKLYLYNNTELAVHEKFMENVDSAKKIGSITLDLSFLEVYDRYGFISREDYIHLADQLKDSNVENINLRYTQLDDYRLVEISAVLKHIKIKNLNLGSNIFSLNGFLALLSALTESQVEVLDLSRNESISLGIHNLVDSLPFTNVTSLDLGDINMGLSCLKHLSNTLPKTKITLLDLLRCSITDEGIQYLSTKLSSSKIQSLNLADNEISFDSLKSLANVLEKTVLTELIIACNGIDSTGAKYLAEKLSKSVLQHLDIGHNLIRSEGCLAIGNVIHLTQIVKLNLQHNSIDSSGITSLADNLNKSNVRHLNMDTNNLQINGAQILANGMKDSNLEYLSVDYNQLSNVGMGMILDALQFTNITDFGLDCESNKMEVENMKFITNAFKCFRLKNLKLKLPLGENIIRVFFNELKSLIESEKLDEILSIKNKMNVLFDYVFKFYADSVQDTLDVMKHFHIKELYFSGHQSDDIEWIPSFVEILVDIKNPISNMKTLDLYENYLGNEGAITLAKNLKYLKLTRLGLGNTEIGNVGVIAIADELKNSNVRYLSLEQNPFDSIAASYLTNVVKEHPVRIHLCCRDQSGFSAEDQIVIKNINFMFLKAQLLVSSVSENSPVKYGKELMEHIKAYEIFKNVDLLWESSYYECNREYKYDYDRVNSEIRSKVNKNFLKIIGVVDSDVINSSLLPTEILFMICSYLNVNDIKFD